MPLPDFDEEPEPCHPLIEEFVKKFTLEAAAIACKHPPWTVETVLEKAGFRFPSATPRVRITALSAWQLALKEEKKNTPPEVLVGGKELAGAYAKWVSGQYALKKEYYEARAKEISTTSTLISDEKVLAKLIKGLGKAVYDLHPHLINSFID